MAGVLRALAVQTHVDFDEPLHGAEAEGDKIKCHRQNVWSTQPKSTYSDMGPSRGAQLNSVCKEETIFIISPLLFKAHVLSNMLATMEYVQILFHNKIGSPWRSVPYESLIAFCNVFFSIPSIVSCTACLTCRSPITVKQLFVFLFDEKKKSNWLYNEGALY